MSSQSDQQENILLSYTVTTACGYAVLTLLTCEWLFTLQDEIVLFWRRTLSGPNILFILNRYITLVSAYSNPLAVSNTVQGYVREVPETSIPLTPEAQFLPAAVFSTLRVHALARSWPVSTLVFVLSNAPTVVNFASTFGIEHATGIPTAAFGCNEITDDVPGYWNDAAILISRLSVILADIIVLVVTWFATYKRGLMKGESRRHSLLFVMLYNGTCYFLVMLIFNVLHIALSFASGKSDSGVPFTSEVTAFTQPITSILISRFLIDLQATNRGAMDIRGLGTGIDLSSQQSSTVSDADTLRFGAVIGSIGTILTGNSDLDAVGPEDQDEKHPGETQSAPSQQSDPMARDEA